MIFRGRYRKVFLKGIALILGGNRALYRERKVAGFFKERIIEEIGEKKKDRRGEISCCFEETQRGNCLVFYRLFTPRLGGYRGEGTGRFGRERRETTFELTNG